MDFKDDLEDDLENVFYSEEAEFAESIDFCGTRINGIFSKITKDSAFFTDSIEEELNVSENSKMLSVKKSDLTLVPKEGVEVTIDNVAYKVIKIIENMGKLDMYVAKMEE